MCIPMLDDIRHCTLCADRFKATASQHSPRPVVWAQKGARVLIAGQAPGARVHASGKPFTDPSGVRLRDWMGINDKTFYDRAKISILPMAFCFPGYTANGADLPPPPICAATWRAQTIDFLGPFDLTLLVGGYAQKWHLGRKSSVTDTVADWQSHAPRVFPLPHPSWRNTSWIKRNPWFETDLLPALKTQIQQVLS